ncbi:hypothetical protein D3C76_934460 [compost metagenome]
MRQGSEDQQGRADHHGVHADIEEQRAGHVHIPQHGQVQVCRVRGQERVTQQHGADPGQGRAQQASAHPAQRPQAHLRLDPLGAGDHVLQDERHRHHQAGDEPAARLVVAAHEQVHRYQQGDWQQQPHQHRRHHHEAQRGVCGVTRVDQVCDHVGRQLALLGGQLHALLGRAEASQQGEHGQGHGDQHGDFTEGVEATEVDQHHIDHIGTAPLRQGAAQVERGNVVGRWPGEHGVRQHRHAATHQHRQQQVAQAAHAGALQAARQR